jgi:hypothetical protein
MPIDSVMTILGLDNSSGYPDTLPERADLEGHENDKFIFLRGKILCLEVEVARQFGLLRLDYNSNHWVALTDVIFRGIKTWMPVDNSPLEDLRDRYATWRGFAPIDANFEPGMDHDERRAAYLHPVEYMLMQLLTKNTKFYVTAKGGIGFVNPASNAQIGDKVYVLFGGDTPFILREDGEHHRLMGPCYQHGLMDGEAIAGWRIGKYKSETITLT